MVGEEAGNPILKLSRANLRNLFSWSELSRLAIPLMFIVMVIVFGMLRPSQFLSFDNLRVILEAATPLAIVATGITIVLALGEFDLSFASLIGLAGATAVFIMRETGVNPLLAVSLAILVGVLIGVVNGLIVGYARVASFIGTLAVSSGVLGLEQALMNNRTEYEGIAEGYLALTNTRLAGVSYQLLICFATVALGWLVLRGTTLGRQIQAVGANSTAAEIAGVKVARVKLTVFVILGVTAVLAGIIITSQSSSYFPNSGTGLLLPAYAAAFLGAAATKNGSFHPMATFFGVIFSQVLQTGLVMTNVAPWVTNLAQGLVLGIAVVLSRGRRNQ